MSAYPEGEEGGIPLVEIASNGEEPFRSDESSSTPSVAASSDVNLLHAPIEDEEQEVIEWAALFSAALLLIILALLVQILVSLMHRDSPPVPSCAPCFLPPPFKVKLLESAPILLKNATLWLGDRYLVSDMLLANGLIQTIGTPITPPPNSVVLSLDLAVVTPGLIDVHSHAGALSYPTDLITTRGDNEYTNPVYPQVRIEDSFDGGDPALPDLLSLGVTSFHILPGSKNVIGGETLMARVKPGATLAEAKIEGALPGMKFAIGQNPKAIYGPMLRTPMTRLGEAWLLRQSFERAAQLKAAQDNWCNASCLGPVPEDDIMQPLVDILRGRRLAHVHVYASSDMEMMLRVAKEFNFSIAAFHHATDAWLVPKLLKRNGITVCTFADTRWFRWEARHGSPSGLRNLVEAGVPIAVMSDHDAHLELMHEAALLWQAGLSEHVALSSVTSTPAKLLGLEKRLGRLAEGMEADVLVWDRHPVRIGARPVYVFQEGNHVYTSSSSRKFGPTSVPITRATLMRNNAGVSNPLNIHSACYAVTVYTMTGTPAVNTTLIVRNGTVTCIGTPSACPLPADILDRFVVSNDTKANNTQSIVTPGFILVGSHLGQAVSLDERTMSDGDSSLSWQYRKASDGVSPANVLVHRACLGGSTVSVNRPMGNALIAGLGVAWKMHGILIDEAVIQDDAGLHIVIGDAEKRGGAVSSISGQISTLRQAFLQTKALNDSEAPLLRVLQGRLLLVAHVHSSDQIAALLRLQKQLGFNMTIVGGAEAYLVASTLAAARVPVILAPVTCSPMQRWPERRCVSDAATRLRAAGVQIGISVAPYADMYMSLSPQRWQAGEARVSGLSNEEALAAVTSATADALGLRDTGAGRIEVGKPANFVLYNADPLELGSRVMLVALGEHLELAPSLP